MTSLGVQLVPWADASPLFDDRAWTTCRVTSRVEFTIDGISVTTFSNVDAPPEHVSVFDVAAAQEAVAIMLGITVLDEEFPARERLPLLVCPCGEAGEGVLSVQLTVGSEEVVWNNWAWETDALPPEWFPELPVCRFRLEDYSAIVHEAGRLSEEAKGQASSIVRVRTQGDGVMRWIEKRVRGELAGQLDWIEVESVLPRAGDGDSELDDLLVNLAKLRAELADAERNRKYTPSREEAGRARYFASRVLESPESFRLPLQTLEAVRWIRRHLVPFAR